MEHPCHGCGAPVEDGVPFCPQCNAPQIRVDMTRQVASPPLPPGTPGQIQPPAQPVTLAPPPPPPERLEWRHGLPSAVAAGVLLAIAWAFPWATFLLWGMVGGAVAVLLYRRRHATAVTPAMGARLGVVTGVFGFLVFAAVAALQLLVTRGAMMRTIWAQVTQQAAANPNPAVQQMIERLSSPAGMAMLFTLVLVFVLAFFLIFASIGGAIGAWLFGGREPQGR